MIKRRMCARCRAEFSAYRRNSKHCSHACWLRTHNTKRRRRRLPAKCVCGIWFSKSRPQRRYCSDRCRNYAAFKRRAGVRLQLRPTSRCRTCHAILKRQRSTAKYCSIRCAHRLTYARLRDTYGHIRSRQCRYYGIEPTDPLADALVASIMAKRKMRQPSL